MATRRRNLTSVCPRRPRRGPRHALHKHWPTAAPQRIRAARCERGTVEWPLAHGGGSGVAPPAWQTRSPGFHVETVFVEDARAGDLLRSCGAITQPRGGRQFGHPLELGAVPTRFRLRPRRVLR